MKLPAILIFTLASVMLPAGASGGVRGDVNGDGAVDAVDIAHVVDLLLGRESAGLSPGSADIDGDGTVNATDVSHLIRIMLGESSSAEGAVDLGLSVDWAAANVGAEIPQAPGYFFAWGETEPKELYTADTCPLFRLTLEELRKWGMVDDAGNLTAEYDAATAALGEGWRMPTLAEVTELIEQCQWSQTLYEGRPTWEVRGPSGAAIYLPLAGYATDGGVCDAWSTGNLWSSTAYEGAFYGYALDLTTTAYKTWLYYRSYGHNVRAVRAKGER